MTRPRSRRYWQKRLLPGILAFLSATAFPHAALLAGQPGPATVPPAVDAASDAGKPEVEAHPALWKISDADTTIYLFGTIHLLPKGVDWFRGPVKSAFDSASQLVTEIVQPDPETMRKITMDNALRKDGKTLRATLAPGARQRYGAALASLGLPAATFDRFDAWFAAVSLTVIPLVRDGYSTDSGVDNQLGDMAAARHIAHVPLETAQYQLGLFASLSPRVQRAYLDQTVRKLPEVSQVLGRMVQAWESGNAQTLGKLMNDDMSDPELMRMLLVERNRNWTGWIEHRLDTPGTVFIAVGAGHLAGAHSVQAMLAKDGIKAVRVQ